MNDRTVDTLFEQTINAKFWLHRGMVYLTELDYANALIHFNNALALDPDLTEAYIHRAIVYLALDRFAEADADVDVDYALQSSPDRLLLLKLKASLRLLVA
jgi:Tfp pilus assembly protein PilF